MKRVFIIHGWEGNTENNWFPWIKNNLETKGFNVIIPEMPDTETPVKAVWLKTLQDLIKNPDKDTYFVGHSMGCQAIQRYLENMKNGEIVGGAVFVAGWINDPKWEGKTEDEIKVVEDWFDQPKDYNKIKSHCRKFVSIFSSDDPFILPTNWKEAEEILGAKVVIVPNKSHFHDEAGIIELPEALEALLEISK
ncbi:serine hydrolase family protein [Patescibacteria group bacterium]|nr:serine hydrolase family protein [Patescibacteria group bacterium]